MRAAVRLLPLLLLLPWAFANTVLFLSLDERYTTRQLVLNLAELSPSSILTPPTSIICHRKRSTNLTELDSWIEAHVPNAQAAILSAEHFIYGGLIQSRISNASASEVQARASLLLQLPDRFPHLKLYVSATVMRIPGYNGDFEEPWYWADYGRDLYQLSFYQSRFSHMKNPEDEKQAAAYRAMVPPGVVREFMWRRGRNQAVLLSLLTGWEKFEALYITLDDNAEFGFNIDEANELRARASSIGVLDRNVLIYPGADEVGASLLARAQQAQPRVGLVWRNQSSTSLIPNYEGQAINITVHAQLRAAGALLCEAQDCDGWLLVNNFDSWPQLEASAQQSNPMLDYEPFGRFANATVALADVRYSNGGDSSLVAWMRANMPETKLAYAGWNTDGNSLGTSIANLVLLCLYGSHPATVKANRVFNLLRLAEDLAYQSRARGSLTSYIAQVEGASVTDLSPQLEFYERFCYNLLQSALEQFQGWFRFGVLQPEPLGLASVYFPWNRTFEIGLSASPSREPASSVGGSGAAPGVRCDIGIAGGSLASLIAAFTAADVDPSISVCLLDPTDWPGGQLTASGVSALDFGKTNFDRKYMSRSLQEFVDSISEAAQQCWVSKECFDPAWAVSNFVMPQLRQRANLRTFLRTVVTGLERDSSTGAIKSISAITRTPTHPEDEWAVLLSADLQDWYDPAASARFQKTAITVSADVFIEATEFGDLLATSGLETRLGAEIPAESSKQTDSACTQAATMVFFVSLTEQSGGEVPPGLNLGVPFSLGSSSWEMAFTYRRSIAASPHVMFHFASEGDSSQQNWGTGNDYNLASLFEASPAHSNWRGGINITALAQAEQRAFGWFHWFAQNAPKKFAGQVQMNRTATGTASGLAKMPYLRDTRRPAEGLKGFVFEYQMQSQGESFDDTVGIGNYPADMHFLLHGPTASCTGYPSYVNQIPTAPFQIPFRALAHDQVPNLLMAGKTIATTFHANAATRVHPSEWATGTAAGAAAALMVQKGLKSTTSVYEDIGSLQSLLQSSTIDQPLRF